MAPRIHIIGRKNHGKTALMVELTQLLTRRGWRVATIKHTHHRHELDTPGKDSYLHREAGAERVGILSPGLSALFWRPHHRERDESRYEEFLPLLAPCDLVLVEGDTQASAPKLEVWRAELHVEPMAVSDPSIRAVISDGDPPVDRPILRRSEPDAIADWILQELKLGPPANRE